MPPDAPCIHVFVGEQQRATALTLHPAFVEKLLWGGKVVGLRVALAKAKASIVRELVLWAWELKAPMSKAPRCLPPPGKEKPEMAMPQRTEQARARIDPFDWHSDPINPATPVNADYRNTQNVRRFMRAQCGAAFRFDRGFMRWIRDGTDKTMGDVAMEWMRRHGAG